MAVVHAKIKEFIDSHNENILGPSLVASFENVSSFALDKKISFDDLSIEKHRLPFINWCTSLANSK